MRHGLQALRRHQSGRKGTSYGLHGRHPRGQAEPAATAIMGKPGAKGHAARGSAADPVCGMLCAKCEMPLHMKQTPAGRVLSHPRTTRTTTREWVFYLPILTFPPSTSHYHTIYEAHTGRAEPHKGEGEGSRAHAFGA